MPKTRSRTNRRTTWDHDEIRQWAEERGGKPTRVKGTGDEEDVGMIRIDFPGFSGEDSLEEISWDAWFEAFDANDLALVMEDTTADGEPSNFNKLVSRQGSGSASRRPGARMGGSRRTAGSTRARNSRSSSSRTGTSSRSATSSRSGTSSRSRSTSRRTTTTPRGMASRGAASRRRTSGTRRSSSRSRSR